MTPPITMMSSGMPMTGYSIRQIKEKAKDFKEDPDDNAAGSIITSTIAPTSV
ncbi:MAG: hypothetical protein ACRD8U_01925 [Pyrinomonadaceae bacterium]